MTYVRVLQKKTQQNKHTQEPPQMTEDDLKNCCSASMGKGKQKDPAVLRRCTLGESSEVSSGEEKQEIHVNYFERITLLVLFMLCWLTKRCGRILHLFSKGRGVGRVPLENIWKETSKKQREMSLPPLFPVLPLFAPLCINAYVDQ